MDESVSEIQPNESGTSIGSFSSHVEGIDRRSSKAIHTCFNTPELCSTSSSMYRAAHVVYKNGASVYICILGVVENVPQFTLVLFICPLVIN